MATAPEEILSVENLEIGFAGRSRGQVIRAVDDVGFKVQKGETFGVSDSDL